MIWFTFPTWSCIHRLDLFSRFQVPEADVRVEGAGGGDGTVVADVHWDHAQLVAFKGPLQLQLLIWPAGKGSGRLLNDTLEIKEV